LTSHFRLRTGTVQGVKHTKLGTNNQDAVLTQQFEVPKRNKTYRVGVISDGCSGIPAFTHSEVGAHLLVTCCLARVQSLILREIPLVDIPGVLYHLVMDSMHGLTDIIMPARTHWPYNMRFTRERDAYRNELNANQRFTVDYLAATLAGFIDDGETLVVFRADDGVLAIDDELFVVDQNNEPAYPMLSPSGSFETLTFASADVSRLCLATDGIKELLTADDLLLPGALFEANPANPMGLQYKLNRLRKECGEKMGDDCTIITRERWEE